MHTKTLLFQTLDITLSYIKSIPTPTTSEQLVLYYWSGYLYGKVIMGVNGSPSFRKRGYRYSHIMKNRLRLTTSLYYTVICYFII